MIRKREEFRPSTKKRRGKIVGGSVYNAGRFTCVLSRPGQADKSVW